MVNIGIDLVNIKEFQRRLEQSGGVEKAFTESELAQNPQRESLAGIFAAKEAFMKAIGHKIDWREVWIEKQNDEQPLLFSPLLSKKERASVSISHDGDYATAAVIVEKT